MSQTDQAIAQGMPVRPNPRQDSGRSVRRPGFRLMIWNGLDYDPSHWFETREKAAEYVRRNFSAKQLSNALPAIVPTDIDEKALRAAEAPTVSAEMVRQLDPFTKGYIECALWSSTDNSDETGGYPLDRNYTVLNITPATFAEMVEDCRQFQEANREYLDECGITSERAGKDFWLTRNRHGTGFWDEGHEPVFRKLTDASHAWGSFDLYVTDDGQIAES